MFSEDRVQTGRQEELDAVRGLSVFLMVGSHVFNQFTPLSQDDVPGDGFFNQVSKLIGAFPGGAQCFMMVMGMLILFSTTVNHAKLIKVPADYIVTENRRFSLALREENECILSFLWKSDLIFISVIKESYGEHVHQITSCHKLPRLRG